MALDGSPGYFSDKSLMLAMVLDGIVGTEGMARVMATYGLGAPDENSLLNGLIAVRPDRDATLRQIWQPFVTGSGNGAADRDRMLELFAPDTENTEPYRREADVLRQRNVPVGTYLDGP